MMIWLTVIRHGNVDFTVEDGVHQFLLDGGVVAAG